MIFDVIRGDIAGISVALIAIFLIFFKWKFKYWEKRNVPFLQPRIPLGNLKFGDKAHACIKLKQHYDLTKSKGWKHSGFYAITYPIYVVTDLNYVRNILTKDFQYFTDRGGFYDEKNDPLSAHLFNLGGQKWRNLRTKITPTFTSGKIKTMFSILLDCGLHLRQKLEKDIDNNQAINIKNLLECFTIDIIGNCAFGLECNSIQDENSPFRRYSRKIFEGAMLRTLKLMIGVSCPWLAKATGMKFAPSDVTNFFRKTVKDIVEYREKNNSTRKDFLQLLIDLKNSNVANEEGYKHDGNTLTMDELTAQCYVFFLAGFETSSTTMTFAFYELAKNLDIQEKLRKEINAVLKKYNNQITYDAMQEMKYMDRVIDETLRKYPPLPYNTRKTVKDYKIPNDNIILEKNTLVVIPVFGIHYDKDIYPNPDKFDPDRFTEENRAARHIYAHLPFGGGPRMCLGARFGLMEIKVGLISLLKHYKFTINNKTPKYLQIKQKSFVLAMEGAIWLNAKKI